MNTKDYTYVLPEEKIAFYPLPRRDTSKLLIYENKQVRHSSFISLPEFLPVNTFLFFNNTKVIPARLHFRKQTGAEIEIFLLHPVKPSALLSSTMQAVGSCTWQCTIGNVKRWPAGLTLKTQIEGSELEAELTDREESHVAFRWSGRETFAQILQSSGETPLPPYLKRKADADDQERYQTIYSHSDGAVAAPTAGLHFTEEVFSALKTKNIQHDFLTLHVSAGTFQPIKTDNADDHIMHEEQIILTRTNVQNMLKPDIFITAVGTTSMRTLESIYWFGVNLLENPECEFKVSQYDAYHIQRPPSREKALGAVLQYMDRKKSDQLTGETSIFIKPGYSFKICQALITNFHQPASTLILLVAAFVGEDWRKIYKEALQNDYRFLSYGDSSLLIP
ncbi:MAG: S-adenosylmethionine:tRNA ribosyltransferase-isomerase [Cyclobacteriaceae bacterium]